MDQAQLNGCQPPPSPADSSPGVSIKCVDDQDMYVDAQAATSHFPTPPVKDEPQLDDLSTLPDFDFDNVDTFQDLSVAEVFSFETCWMPSDDQIAAVRDVVLCAPLPPEVVAVALNILTEVGPHRGGSVADPDLLVVSSLALADIYTNDQPATVSAWSSELAHNRFTAKEIDATMLKILALLDWRLHRFTAPEVIYYALCRLAGSMSTALVAEDMDFGAFPGTADGLVDVVNQVPLKLIVDTDAPQTCWSHGLVTPATTPQDSVFDKVPRIRLPHFDFCPDGEQSTLKGFHISDEPEMVVPEKFLLMQ